MIGLDCINFKDSLLSVTNMDTTDDDDDDDGDDDDDDDDVISAVYYSKKNFNYISMFLLMIIPKKIQKDYQLTIATIVKAMFHHSDSIVRFYK